MAKSAAELKCRFASNSMPDGYGWGKTRPLTRRKGGRAIALCSRLTGRKGERDVHATAIAYCTAVFRPYGSAVHWIIGDQAARSSNSEASAGLAAGPFRLRLTIGAKPMRPTRGVNGGRLPDMAECARDSTDPIQFRPRARARARGPSRAGRSGRIARAPARGRCRAPDRHLVRRRQGGRGLAGLDRARGHRRRGGLIPDAAGLAPHPPADRRRRGGRHGIRLARSRPARRGAARRARTI